MNRSIKSASLSFLAPLALIGALSAGCGDSSASPDSSAQAAGSGSSAKKAGGADSAKPGTSTTTAAKPPTSTNPGTPAPSGSAVAQSGTAQVATPPVAAGASADLFKVLPAKCTEMRMYANVGSLTKTALKSQIDDGLNQLIDKLGKKVDAEKAKAVLKVATDANVIEALRGIAVCGEGHKDAFVAINFDAATLKGSLGDALSKMIEAGTGKAPTKKDDGGVTYITMDDGKGVGAVTGTTLVIGKSAEDVKAAITAAAGAAGFAGADANLVWISAEEKNISGTINQAGDDWVFKASGPPALFKSKDPAEADKAIQGAIEKFGPKLDEKVKGISDILKNVKVGADGANWTIELKVSNAQLQGIAKEIQAKGPEGLGGAF